MILIITNTEDATADYLCQNYLDRTPYFRVNTDASPAGIVFSLVDGEFRLLLREGAIEPRHISGVWYRRPGRIAPPIEPSEDPAIDQFIVEEWIEAFEAFLEAIPSRLWVNHPRANVRASRKLHQLQVAKTAGLRTPASLLTVSPHEARKFMRRYGAVISKPLGSGLLRRKTASSFVYTSEISPGALARGERFSSPTFFQERIVKVVDVRVTVIDATMTAITICNSDTGEDQPIDVRRTMLRTAKYAPIDIPTDVAEGISKLLTYYDLRFGALDFAIDRSGQWVFFEINPNGQWAWLDIEAGLGFGRHLAQHLMGADRWVG